jgi:hypothetical protein
MLEFPQQLSDQKLLTKIFYRGVTWPRTGEGISALKSALRDVGMSHRLLRYPVSTIVYSVSRVIQYLGSQQGQSVVVFEDFKEWIIGCGVTSSEVNDLAEFFHQVASH